MASAGPDSVTFKELLTQAVVTPESGYDGVKTLTR